MTGQSVIGRALRKLGALNAEAGEVASGPRGDDALVELQALVDEMNAQRPVLFTVGRLALTWTASQSERTIGQSAANFAQDRPGWIDAWAVIPVGQTSELGPRRILSDAEYAAISYKAQTSDYFSDLYYRPTFPNGTLVAWPVPTTAPTLVLYVPSHVSTFSDLATAYTAPPGYENYFVYELAKRLAPEYGKAWTRELEEIRTKAEATIKIANIKIPQYGPMPAGLRGQRRGVSQADLESGNF